MVVAGSLTIQLRDGDVVLGPQDVYVVPRGSSTARGPTRRSRALLVELAGTLNTGDAGGARTSETRELPG